MSSPFSYANPSSSPRTVVPAVASPSVSGTTSTQQAYGLAKGTGGPQTAPYGTMILGVGGALVLLYLYYSLPR
jgi:hypothetical protein